MLTYYRLLKYAAKSTLAYRMELCKKINRKLQSSKKLPFKVYMSEDSTPDILVFRVEHRKAFTANRVVVTMQEWELRAQHKRYRLHIDASDGSNWHHKKFEFVTWFRNFLLSEAEA
jgi:hypothetical protein